MPSWLRRTLFDVSHPARECRGPHQVRTHGIFRRSEPNSTYSEGSEMQFSQAMLPPTRAVQCPPPHVNFSRQFCVFCHHARERTSFALSSTTSLPRTPLDESGSLVRSCKVSFRTSLRTVGVTSSLNHRKTIPLVSNTPWSRSVNSQTRASKESCPQQILVVPIRSLASTNEMPISEIFLQLAQSLNSICVNSRFRTGRTILVPFFHTDNFIGHFFAPTSPMSSSTCIVLCTLP